MTDRQLLIAAANSALQNEKAIKSLRGIVLAICFVVIIIAAKVYSSN